MASCNGHLEAASDSSTPNTSEAGSGDTVMEQKADDAQNADLVDLPVNDHASVDLRLSNQRAERPDSENYEENEPSSADYCSSEADYKSFLSSISITELNGELPIEYSIPSNKGDSFSPNSSPRREQNHHHQIDYLDLYDPEEYIDSNYEIMVSDASDEFPQEIFPNMFQVFAVICHPTTLCSEKRCIQLRERLKQAEDSYECLDNLHICQYIQQHVESECFEPECPVPFCALINDNDGLPVEHAIQVSSRTWWKQTFQELKKHGFNYTQLHDTAPSRLSDALDCNFLCNLGSFGHFSTILTNDESRYSILRKMISQDTDSRIQLLQEVSSFSCPNIAQHYWAIEYGQHIYVSLQFEMAGSLEEYVELLSISQICHSLRQLLNAASFLHGQTPGIIYLLWTCANVQINFDAVTKTDFTLKLSNFSAAVHEEEALDDPDVIGDIYMSVQPACILPPELKDDGPCLKSDIWGLGCIAYELLHVYKVHHDLRHNLPEVVREKIGGETLPDISGSKAVKFQELFDLCFQVKPGERGSLDELLKAIL